ncbi:hypothetical protein [Adhaeribacter terreus]|uniref:Uncharacterized protein n=1 Tax=Adhaeribacter terreus TaxID=529703 RepID=A0ABW0EF38_9BACT
MHNLFSPAPFPVKTLYSLQNNYTWKGQSYNLEPGVSVILEIFYHPGCDLIGGHREDYLTGDSFYVEVLEVQENRIKGKVEEDGLFFKAGSIIWFEAKHIHRVRGNLGWNINNLTVSVSEKILYGKEKVGYFYNTLSEQPMSFGRVFYSVSEIPVPHKDYIPLVEMPLKDLVAHDPILLNYLEDHAMDGWLRTDENSFVSFEDQPCDRRIFPAGYETDYEFEEGDASEEDSLPF